MSKPKNHNYNPSNRLSPEDWAQRFDDLLLKERKIVFQIGDALIAAQEELSKAGFQEAIKKSGLRTKTTALNYMRVAQSEHLRAPEVQKQLPATVGALIDLAAWSQKEVEKAIEKKVLHPQSQRKPLQKWVEHQRYIERVASGKEEAPKSVTEPDSAVVGYIVASKADFSKDDREKIEMTIWRLQKELPMFNFSITTSQEDPSITLHRRHNLASRIQKAYEDTPQLFVDADFKKIVDVELGGDITRIEYHLHKVAFILASADHKELHKVLKFSKAEWKFLGVENPGHSTVLPFIDGALNTAKVKSKSARKK